MPATALNRQILILKVGLFTLLLGLTITQALAGEQSFTSGEGTDITIETWDADGSIHLVWMPSEDGPQEVERGILDQISRLGISAWRVDLQGAHFLPATESSMDQLPGQDVSDLLQFAVKTTGKQVFLVTTGRGAIPFLRGIHRWQRQQTSQSGFGGLILLSPKLFVETPEPGTASRIMPIVSHSDLPVVLLQAAQSPWYWKLDQTVPALKQSGSEVIVKVLPDVRDRFYFRPEQTATEQATTRDLPRLLLGAMESLAAIPVTQRKPPALKSDEQAASGGRKERVLKPYKGNPEPPELKLSRRGGGTMDLADLKGKVVLVNFWASWCPPCVKEMPSMERLQTRLSDQPFVILAVNMAEEEPAINEFLRTRVNVTFPILLDLDGAALKRWKVFAFPTSYVIDKKGRIRFALFGSYEWDQEDAIAKLNSLLTE